MKRNHKRLGEELCLCVSKDRIYHQHKFFYVSSKALHFVVEGYDVDILNSYEPLLGSGWW